MNTSKAIGDQFRKIRKLRNLTQGEVCAKTGLTQNNYWAYEVGRREMPLPTMNQIAEALGCELNISLVDKAGGS